MPEINGCLFPNDRGPSHKGFIEIDGVRHQIVCWPRESKKDGKPFLGISADAPRDAPERRAPRQYAPRRDDDRDAPF